VKYTKTENNSPHTSSKSMWKNIENHLSN